MSPEVLTDAARYLEKAKELRALRMDTDATGVSAWGLKLTGRMNITFDVKVRDEINGAISSILGRLAAKYEERAIGLVRGEIGAFDAKASGDW